MEILALLLLGLIAMLAIVPPIIRGKLDESPLASTQSFQRSMQEMANSIESGASREEARYGGGGLNGHLKPAGHIYPGHPLAVSAHGSSRKRAAVRRNRVTAALTVFAATWGAISLLSGKTWCLVVFAITCGILAAFWGMALIIPNRSTRPHAVRHHEEVPRSSHSQAL